MTWQFSRKPSLACAAIALSASAIFAEPSALADPPARDAQHDFDFNAGVWAMRIKRLTGSGAWVDLIGTATVRKMWSGRAQLEEIEANGAAGHLEALVMILYNPQSHQWSKTFASSDNGQLGTPMAGGFQNGRGEFYDQESFHGRMQLLRAVWSDITANTQHFEESSSDDGGRNWKPYFIADFTRK